MKASELAQQLMLQPDREVLMLVDGEWREVNGMKATGQHRNAITLDVAATSSQSSEAENINETRVKHPLVVFCNVPERKIPGCTTVYDDHWYPGKCVEVRIVINGRWEFGRRWIHREAEEVTDFDIIREAGVETEI